MSPTFASMDWVQKPCEVGQLRRMRGSQGLVDCWGDAAAADAVAAYEDAEPGSESHYADNGVVIAENRRSARMSEGICSLCLRPEQKHYHVD